MVNIDRQRIAAVKTLEALGHTFDGTAWVPPAGLQAGSTAEADRLHALLVMRADALEGCTEGSREADEVDAITEALEDYEALR
jgi:hypothetical protein